MLFTWFSLSFCASWGKLRHGFSDVIYLFLRQTCDSVVYPVRLFITGPCGSLLASTLCPEPRDYVSERRAGRVLGAGMNPRPLGPATPCPQARALTPACTGDTRRLQREVLRPQPRRPCGSHLHMPPARRASPGPPGPRRHSGGADGGPRGARSPESPAGGSPMPT